MYQYDDPRKNLLWRAHYEGYAMGKSVEQLGPVSEEAARSEFERWYDREVDTDMKTEVFIDG